MAAAETELAEVVDDEDTNTAMVGDEEIQTAISETQTYRPDQESSLQPKDDNEDEVPSPSAASDGTSEQKAEQKGGYETTIELPRDILTGWVLMEVSGKWDKMSRASTFCILFGVVFSWGAQFTVFASLIVGTIEGFLNDFEVSFSGTDFLYNLVAISSLFMYLWRDVMAYYNSVWYYVGIKEKEHLEAHHVGNMGNLAGGAMKNIAHLDAKKMAKSLTGETAQNLLSFGKFRVFLVASFVLYAGFALYSLVEIAATDGITDKLEVAINIFFVLEIDDWACDLFILGPGILDDADFDVDVVLPQTEEEHAKSTEKQLKWITGLLMGSILACYGFSYYHVALKD